MKALDWQCRRFAVAVAEVYIYLLRLGVATDKKSDLFKQKNKKQHIASGIA